MILYIIALLIGLLLLGTGLYYLIKEKEDLESRKIYGAAMVAGVIIALFGAIGLFGGL